jgi:hypothetical protein
VDIDTTRYPTEEDGYKWSTYLSGQAYGNGRYKVKSSPTYTWDTENWWLFDSNQHLYDAHWDANNHYSSSGVFTLTADSQYTLDGSYYGDWVYIGFPAPISVTRCTFTGREGLPERAPGKFVIYGSDDGLTWVVLYRQDTTLAYGANNVGSISIASVPKAFKFIALVVSQTKGGDVLNFRRWRIWGVEEVCCL